MKKKEKKIIIFLIIIILMCVGAILYLLFTRRTPDYAPIDIDPNAVETKEKKEKLKAAKGGGAVALSYDSQVAIILNNKNITLRFKNPSQSTQNMSLKILIEDNVIAESNLIPPGYSIYNLNLKDNVNLKQGNYEGKFLINYYDDNNEKANIDTVIPIKIVVQ
ncbi:MAG: hypothetical protein IKF91_03335 [Bacilli bacterium]|nr:hypothetical protein [Bacilli bacterium]